MKKIAILQSNYLPWAGYFDLIDHVDEFIILDGAQFTKRDWRNRNKIKTPTGSFWLTVPVITKGRFNQKISDTQIDGGKWRVLHLRSLEQNYKRAPYYNEISQWLFPVIEDASLSTISELNVALIVSICEYLGIETVLVRTTTYDASQDKTERLANICLLRGADEYVSGPSARAYIDPTVFERRGLLLSYYQYWSYAEYPQLWGPFIKDLSVVDMLFNCGRRAVDLRQSAREHVTAALGF